MREVFEIECISKKYIPVAVCTCFFQEIGLPFIPQEVEHIRNNWNDLGKKQLPFQKDSFEGYIAEGYTVFLYGKVNSLNAGITFSKTDDSFFNTTFWFISDVVPGLSTAWEIRKDNPIYDRIEKSIFLFEPFVFLFAAMGIETHFDYHFSFEETRKHSIADRWVQAHRGQGDDSINPR